MNGKFRSDHVTYELEDHLSSSRRWIRQAIISLILQAFKLSGASKEHFKILDAGCGFGILMRDMKALGFEVIGLDVDPICVEYARQFGSCILGDINDIDQLFPSNTFDLVVSSHSLEHMTNPKETVDKLKVVAKDWIVIAVPNPVRPQVLLKYDLLRMSYSNKGHLYCWDRSHLENFLVRHCGLTITSWATDYIHAVPTKFLRSLLQRLGMLELIEVRFLPWLFPYFSTSLIALCHLSHRKTIRQ